MTNQMKLRIVDESPVTFRLDDRTREIGRRGLAEARAALQSSSSPTAQSRNTATAA